MFQSQALPPLIRGLLDAAAYPHEPWVEHFDWLHPLFNERTEISGGRIHLSERPGLGVTLSDQARAWTVDRTVIRSRFIPFQK